MKFRSEFFAFIGVLVFLSEYFQRVTGDSPVAAGLRVAALGAIVGARGLDTAMWVSGAALFAAAVLAAILMRRN